MYGYIFGLSSLKSITPYFRKHILKTLDSHELVYLTTFLIFICVFFLFLYKFFFDEKFVKTIENFKRLTLSQVAAIIVITLITVVSSFFLYELEKNHNNPMINYILTQFTPLLFMLIIGIVFLKEKYNFTQIVGFILLLLGVFLISKKT